MKVTIGIVDDKFKLISSLKNNLELYPDIDIIWTATSGADAVSECQKKIPDLILMDIEMPGMDGIETTAALKKTYPDLKIVMLTVFDDNDKIFEAILAGASGYLLKDSLPVKIREAIKEAIDGGAPMSPIIASKALQLINSMHAKKENEETVTGEQELGLREMEILKYTATGMTYLEIADKLFISPKTVRNHIQNIYKKLQVSSKTEAINLAHKKRWI
jgi:DNA-binding NarL/FixJ family response regulator